MGSRLICQGSGSFVATGSAVKAAAARPVAVPLGAAPGTGALLGRGAIPGAGASGPAGRRHTCTWRRRTGIEPADDAVRRPPILKTGGTTRNPDASEIRPYRRHVARRDRRQVRQRSGCGRPDRRIRLRAARLGPAPASHPALSRVRAPQCRPVAGAPARHSPGA
jgi:hypothetical protein